MIKLIKQMLEKHDMLELRGEPWLLHIKSIARCKELKCVKIPLVEPETNASTPKVVACWVRNGQVTELMAVAAEANSEKMMEQLSKNYILVNTLKEVVPKAELYVRAYGLTQNRIDFKKTGAGVRVCLRHS